MRSPKLFILSLLLICSLVAKGQQTYFTPGVPTSSTSFSPTWRYIGTDSLTNFYVGISNRWSQFYTSAQANKRFAQLGTSSGTSQAAFFNPANQLWEFSGLTTDGTTLTASNPFVFGGNISFTGLFTSAPYTAHIGLHSDGSAYLDTIKYLKNQTNGLQIISPDSIGLGGVLTQSTAINTQGNSLTFLNNVNGFSVIQFSTNVLTQQFSGSSGYTVSSIVGETGMLNEVVNNNNGNTLGFELDSAVMKFNDNINNVGAVYGADYSSNGHLNPLWIPNWGYVQSQIPGSGGGAPTVVNSFNGRTGAVTPQSNDYSSYYYQQLTPTAVQTSNYTATVNQLVYTNTTSNSLTITLPNAPASGTLMAIKMITVGTGHTTTIATSGSDVFNKTGGDTTLSLSLLNQGNLIQYNSGIWTVLSDDVPLSQLDARYINSAITVLTDSTKFSSYAGGARTVALKDTIIGDGSIFVKLPKGTNKANGGTIYASNTVDSLWYRQYSGKMNLRWWGCNADYNPKTGTWTTDNSPKINQAIGSVPYGSGWFILANGKGSWYYCGSTILLCQNTVISAENSILTPQFNPSDTVYYHPETILKFPVGVQGIGMQTTGNYRDQNCYLLDLGFEGGGKTTTYCTGIKFNSNPNYTTTNINSQDPGMIFLHHVTVNDFPCNIDWVRCDTYHWEGMSQSTNSHCGMKGGKQDGFITLGNIWNCDTLIYNHGGNWLVIAENELETSPHGIIVDSLQASIIHHNTFKTLTGNGVQMTGSSNNNRIDDNVINNPQGEAIYINNVTGTGNTVDNNTINYAQTTCIHVRGTGRITIQGNNYPAPVCNNCYPAARIDTSTNVTYSNNIDGMFNQLYRISATNSSLAGQPYYFSPEIMAAISGLNTTPEYRSFTYGGTYQSPTAVTSGTVIGGIQADGYDGSTLGTALRAAITFTANENFTTSNKGTGINFEINQNTTNAPAVTGTMTWATSSNPIFNWAGQITALGGSGFSFEFGSDATGNTLTNLTNAIGRIGSPAYVKTQNPVTTFNINNTINSNTLNFGGGTIQGQSITQGNLYATSTVNGGSGSIIAGWNTAGLTLNKLQTGTAGTDSIVVHASSGLQKVISATLPTASIANNAITYAKIQTEGNNTILGNNSGSTGVPLALTAAQVSAIIATATPQLITGTPTIALGAGAGTSPGTPTITTNGKQLQVTITTGTLPTGTNATIATITLPNALSYTPYPVFSGANANTSLLSAASMVYMTASSGSTVIITSGTTALTAATTYVWNISL